MHTCLSLNAKTHPKKLSQLTMDLLLSLLLMLFHFLSLIHGWVWTQVQGGTWWGSKAWLPCVLVLTSCLIWDRIFHSALHAQVPCEFLWSLLSLPASCSRNAGIVHDFMCVLGIWIQVLTTAWQADNCARGEGWGAEGVPSIVTAERKTQFSPT